MRPEGATAEGVPVRFTARGDTLYAWLLGAPGASVELLGVSAQSARLVGGGALELSATQRGVKISLPALADEPAHAIALGGVRETSAA
jgi:hypothetical protein